MNNTISFWTSSVRYRLIWISVCLWDTLCLFKDLQKLGYFYMTKTFSTSEIGNISFVLGHTIWPSFSVAIFAKACSPYTYPLGSIIGRLFSSRGLPLIWQISLDWEQWAKGNTEASLLKATWQTGHSLFFSPVWR